MKLKSQVAGLAVWCLAAALAHAATPNPQFLGNGELDFANSSTPPMPAGISAEQFRPTSYTITLKDLGSGKWSEENFMVLPGGKATSSPPMTWNNNGPPSAVAGHPGMDALSVVFSDPNTANVTFLINGNVLLKHTYKLSADGKHIFDSLEMTGPDGKLGTYPSVFNRK